MRKLFIPAAWLWGRAAFVTLLGLVFISAALPARAFTSADADTMFAAHTKAFYRMTNGAAYFAKSSVGNRRADFWTEAEQMEMVLDACERKTSEQPLMMFTNLFRGFMARHGRNWATNDYNDDIMWMVIACTRAHLLTGNPEFREVARANFDLCYARAASTASACGGLRNI